MAEPMAMFKAISKQLDGESAAHLLVVWNIILQNNIKELERKLDSETARLWENSGKDRLVTDALYGYLGLEVAETMEQKKIIAVKKKPHPEPVIRIENFRWEPK